MTRDSDKKPARGAKSGAPSFVSKSKGSRSHGDTEGKSYKKPPANPYAKKGAPKIAPAKGPEAGADGTRPGDRIAKVLARAGVASRRDCEVIIDEGRVTVNGRKVVSPALNVLPGDRITVDGQQIGEAEPPRLWLYHKPLGLVTTEKDELGRKTVFENLPAGLPRVLSVGRLDLNSEGLLLLTNDGELKRKLELPDTGWLRKYRVRVKGSPSEALLDQLRKGVTIDGEDFQPMEVVFDRQQGANAWLTVGIREGRNREVRRAMEHIGVIVNRLMRISYGPFRLGTIRPGQAEEVKARVLRDQLGVDPFASDIEHPSEPRRQVSRGGKPAGPRKESFGRTDSRDRDDRGPKGAEFKSRGERDDRGPKGSGYKGKSVDRDGKPDFKSAGYKSRGGPDGGRAKGFKSHGDKPTGGRDGKPSGGPRGGNGFGGGKKRS
ncbi:MULTISPECIES: pseudouridine synthase [Pacificibacter]|uniref:pseudouridine synthase n=1 Tax=Pacificibacter TaxID=1042323 RepID=UPI001C08E401|nr:MULTISPECIES: pseudouridine synthase [Pacificibacter]MBU2937503.1 rRNA pseudouridine synthase [Pacificibacter marinus]MDO6615683.1 pseudouridine synthase [Pacificibacter sp. 1_MG-2023]